MRVFRFLLFPLGLLYGAITMFRNWLYKVRIKRSFKFSLPIINIGNLSMGGTGKTPHTEYLIRLLKDNHNLATLSRGYGRKVYGFQIADELSSAWSIGDEPMQFHNKFNDEIIVAVDADRVNGVSEICYRHETTDLILLDDAYQHRSIQPGFNILLTDYNVPFYSDFILPVGNLRELRNGKRRADIIVVTKCPEFNTIDKKKITQNINPNTGQYVFFSRIRYGKIHGLTNFNNLDKPGSKLIVVTGIANPSSLIQHLSKDHQIIKHFNYPDHYSYKEKDIVEIHNLLTKFADDEIKIVTTEKDAMRLKSNQFKDVISDKPWFYQEIRVEIDNNEKFNTLILDYVQKNRRDY